MSQFLDIVMNCSVCDVEFSPERPEVTLPCGNHSFCKLCVSKIELTEEKKCPTCNQTWEQEIIDKSFLALVKLTLGETRPTEARLSIDDKISCEDHGKEFCYWCNDCNTLMCIRCAISSHKNHEFDLLDDKTQLSKIKKVLVKDLNSLSEELTKEVESVDHRIAVVEGKMQRLEAFAKEVENESKELEKKKLLLNESKQRLLECKPSLNLIEKKINQLDGEGSHDVTIRKCQKLLQEMKIEGPDHILTFEAITHIASAYIGEKAKGETISRKNLIGAIGFGLLGKTWIDDFQETRRSFMFTQTQANDLKESLVSEGQKQRFKFPAATFRDSIIWTIKNDADAASAAEDILKKIPMKVKVILSGQKPLEDLSAMERLLDNTKKPLPISLRFLDTFYGEQKNNIMEENLINLCITHEKCELEEFVGRLNQSHFTQLPVTLTKLGLSYDNLLEFEKMVTAKNFDCDLEIAVPLESTPKAMNSFTARFSSVSLHIQNVTEYNKENIRPLIDSLTPSDAGLKYLYFRKLNFDSFISFHRKFFSANFPKLLSGLQIGSIYFDPVNLVHAIPTEEKKEIEEKLRKFVKPTSIFFFVYWNMNEWLS